MARVAAISLPAMIQLFEDLSSVEQDADPTDATPEGQALREVISEVDDIARATLGSITIATMRKLVDRHAFSGAGRSKAVISRRRNQSRL